ncbi:MAG TPA: hypothetical protein VHQ94_06105 [Pyrinomonadaceae bacterium]|nr:hypothetical protein [Pyrinomonadaceae bacterium]
MSEKRDPFPFVLAELEPIRPTIKRMFGFTYVYQGEMLLCALRDSKSWSRMKRILVIGSGGSGKSTFATINRDSWIIDGN